ncbi:MAG: hypothetical protein QXT77_06950 [Candidatus Methanomethylicaceae archaeon]
MKYTVKSEQAMKNIIHNVRQIDEHLDFKREIGEGYDERYMQLARIKDEMMRQLGEWYYIRTRTQEGW